MSETLLHPIPPFYEKNSRVLILGSFPSVKSREAMFFYGHAQNRFWQVIARADGSAVPCTVEEKKVLLSRRRIALFDVLSACEIKGSADSSIKGAHPTDLSPILQSAGIERILCNGKTSFFYYQKFHQSKLGRDAIPLPSTSPANAAFSLDALFAAWHPYLL